MRVRPYRDETFSQRRGFTRLFSGVLLCRRGVLGTREKETTIAQDTLLTVEQAAARLQISKHTLNCLGRPRRRAALREVWPTARTL
jgi:hypothetical protein